MYAFTHKFHVHIIQEHIVDTDRCVSLHASAPARHSDCRCTFGLLIAFVGTASNRQHVAKPSCRTHRGSLSPATCQPPACCRTRPSCHTNSMFVTTHSTQVHLPATWREQPARQRSSAWIVDVPAASEQDALTPWRTRSGSTTQDRNTWRGKTLSCIRGA